MDLDENARIYFQEPRERNGRGYEGITPDKNVYRLFIYRALDYWCRQVEDGAPGKLAFVIPLSFCGGEDAKALRHLFTPNGRWTIREIVDMELIWRHVFDADVLPMILIAEARAPQESDEVVIRLADESCVIQTEGAKRPTFDFFKVPEIRVAYARLFGTDERILTRLSPERATIIEKLRAAKTFRDVAKPYWTRRRRGGQDVMDVQPDGMGQARWEEQRLVRYGLALRGSLSVAASGLDLYKGENIRTGGLVGEPVHKSVDVAAADSPSVWAYPEILPNRLFAFPLIEQVPCAAPFDPRREAVLNTVTIFGPRSDLVDFPFDALVISRIYSFYYILALRRSFMNKLRSHLYPSAIAELPWSDSLIAVANNLRKLRSTFSDACQRRYAQGEGLVQELRKLQLQPLRNVYRAATTTPLVFSPEFEDGEDFILEVAEPTCGDELVTIPLSIDGHAINVPAGPLTQLFVSGLKPHSGEEFSRNKLLTTRVPPNPEVAEQLNKVVESFSADRLELAVEQELDRIDELVGTALGLTKEEVEFIKREMAEDPFLSRIRPRYPFFTPRQRGRRLRLVSVAKGKILRWNSDF